MSSPDRPLAFALAVTCWLIASEELLTPGVVLFFFFFYRSVDSH